MSGPPFQVIPAIDLLRGRVVNLVRGEYDRATEFGDDPLATADGFLDAGAARLHVVDLDGARTGRRHHRDALRAVAARAREREVPVQLGGGLRTPVALEEAFADGVERAILGTLALRDPGFVRDAARRFPGRVAVGIDARGGRVAVEGWLETSDATAVELARRFEDAGVAALVYTDIERDGMLEGPAFEATAALAEAVSIPVILSGGIASEDDVLRAAALAPRGVVGAIVGRALYTGAVRIDRVRKRLEEAACC